MKKINLMKENIGSRKEKLGEIVSNSQKFKVPSISL